MKKIRIITSVVLIILGSIVVKAQLYDTYAWKCDPCKQSQTRVLNKLSRDGTVWKAKVPGNLDYYNVELFFTDSNHFKFIWYEKGAFGYTSFLQGKVSDSNTLVFHGYAFDINTHGDTISKSYYKNNFLDGKTWSYDYRDSTEKFLNYKNGTYQGQYKLVKNGRIQVEGNFADNKYHGEWKYYDAGILVAKGKYLNENYDDTVQIEVHKLIFSNYTSSPVKLQRRTGKWMYYSPSGELIRTEYYSKTGVLEKAVFHTINYRLRRVEDITPREIMK